MKPLLRNLLLLSLTIATGIARGSSADTPTESGGMGTPSPAFFVLMIGRALGLLAFPVACLVLLVIFVQRWRRRAKRGTPSCAQ